MARGGLSDREIRQFLCTEEEDFSGDSTDDDEIDCDISEVLSTSEIEWSGVSSDNDVSTGTVFRSKNGLELWNAAPFNAAQGRASAANIILQKSGPTRYANREVDNEKSAFSLFFRNKVIETICKWTNKEGNIKFRDAWKAVSVQELQKYIGVLVLIGVYKSKNEETRQLWSKENGRPLFSRVMSRNRFQQISSALRFDDADLRRHSRPTDKLSPIRELFEDWTKNLQDAFIPGDNMTVDEQLVTFRGRCPFRQYIPSKPGKYGIKFWVICDSTTSYVWNMQIYSGKNPKQGREANQGERVVLQMTEQIAGSGRNITADNFFTSLSLARKLKQRKLTYVGTIRKNKPELPPVFIKA